MAVIFLSQDSMRSLVAVTISINSLGALHVSASFASFFFARATLQGLQNVVEDILYT